jgi:WD40 repeat protein
VWDTASGEEAFAVRHPEEIHAVAFSPNGRWLGSVGSGGHISVWDASTGGSHSALRDPGKKPLVTLAFHPHHNVLATGGGFVARLWPIPD